MNYDNSELRFLLRNIYYNFFKQNPVNFIDGEKRYVKKKLEAPTRVAKKIAEEYSKFPISFQDEPKMKIKILEFSITNSITQDEGLRKNRIRWGEVFIRHLKKHGFFTMGVLISMSYFLQSNKNKT